MMAVTASVGWDSLRAHRLRSALTMLGVIIGVAAVVAMIAIGNGARDQIQAQIRSLGSNLIGISQGSTVVGGTRLGSDTSARLGEDDALAIGAEVPGVVAVAPMLYSRPQLSAGSANWVGRVRGVTPEYFVVREWNVAHGREMIAEDHSRIASVVLLGAVMRDKLFAGGEAIGATVRLNGVPFTVIGVLARKGQSVWGHDEDDVALVPLSTARRRLVGVNLASPRAVHGITVKFAPGESATRTMASIADLLRERHRLQAGQEETFVLRDLAEVAGVEHAATNVMFTLLAAIASVSLLVGGIGIMNIMLVSVTERTREIGLRLAVGARRRDILAQFVVEATTLSLLGGALGALVGIAGSFAIARLAEWPLLIGPGTVLVAMVFAGAVGVFFGLYPARQAARLDPMAALRYE